MCTPMLITTLFTLVKMYNQTKGPTAGEWIKKMWCGYTMEFYSDIQKNEITVFAEYRDATEDHHLTLTKTGSEKSHISSLHGS